MRKEMLFQSRLMTENASERVLASPRSFESKDTCAQDASLAVQIRSAHLISGFDQNHFRFIQCAK